MIFITLPFVRAKYLQIAFQKNSDILLEADNTLTFSAVFFSQNHTWLHSSQLVLILKAYI